MSDITRLEEEIAHLRRHAEELSEVVRLQSDEIATLTRRVEMLLKRAAEQEAAGAGGVVLSDERPPHY